MFDTSWKCILCIFGHTCSGLELEIREAVMTNVKECLAICRVHSGMYIWRC